MRYDMKKIISTSALALVLGLANVSLCSAQGVVSLSDDAKANNNADEIPNEISLFGDDNTKAKMITPAKSTTGVKSAAELLGNKAAPANGVKSAAELLGNKAAQPKAASGVKSAAELLGNNSKDAANNTGVKSAKDLLAPKPVDGQPKVLSAAELLNAKQDNALPAGVKPLSAADNSKPADAAEVKPASNVLSAKNLLNNGNIDMQIVKDVDNDVFNKMSDLEQQTAILNLELKKEKVKSDIESLKAVQEKARQEEQARQEEERRKVQEWRNEEKRKLLQEKQKLKELEIAFEKERQEKLLNNYKNKMLSEKQDFIKTQASLYEEIRQLKDERQALVSDFKGRFVQLTKLADKATNDAIRTRDSYAKTISDLQTQISILKARLEANKEQNPFADGKEAADVDDDNAVKISDLYAVMEIRGQGNNMTAKLINETGFPFLVKVGTTLQSGHIVDEITSTYVRADKEGRKDYLYFSAGGILDKEPVQNDDIKVKSALDKKKEPAAPSVILSDGIPGVASEMTIR